MNVTDSPGDNKKWVKVKKEYWLQCFPSGLIVGVNLLTQPVRHTDSVLVRLVECDVAFTKQQVDQDLLSG